MSVGLLWQGNPAHFNDRRRSVQLDSLREALERGDLRDAERSAHTLKGSLSHFLDPLRVAPLQELVSTAKAGRLDEARQRFTGLEALAEGLLLSMSHHLFRPADAMVACPAALDTEVVSH